MALAASLVSLAPSSIYDRPFGPPSWPWSPYERWGVYQYPFAPEFECGWPPPPIPSLFWPPDVFEEVTEALAAVLLADLRGRRP